MRLNKKSRPMSNAFILALEHYSCEVNPLKSYIAHNCPYGVRWRLSAEFAISHISYPDLPLHRVKACSENWKPDSDTPTARGTLKTVLAYMGVDLQSVL